MKSSCFYVPAQSQWKSTSDILWASNVRARARVPRPVNPFNADERERALRMAEFDIEHLSAADMKHMFIAFTVATYVSVRSNVFDNIEDNMKLRGSVMLNDESQRAGIVISHSLHWWLMCFRGEKVVEYPANGSESKTCMIIELRGVFAEMRRRCDNVLGVLAASVRSKMNGRKDVDVVVFASSQGYK